MVNGEIHQKETAEKIIDFLKTGCGYYLFAGSQVA